MSRSTHGTVAIVSAIAAMALAANSAQAAYVWNATAATGNWNDSTWTLSSGDTGYPHTAGAVVTFPTLASGSPTITINTADATAGSLTLTASDYTSRKWTITSSTNSLTLDNGASAATITASGQNDSHLISAPIVLNSDLSVSVGTNSTLTVSGSITPSSGNKSLTKNGNGTLALSAANAFAGPITVNAGMLDFGTSSSANSFTGSNITVASSAGVILRGANNALTGNLTLSQGKWVAGHAGSFGTANVSISGTLGIVGGTSIANTINISGTLVKSTTSGNDAALNGSIALTGNVSATTESSGGSLIFGGGLDLAGKSLLLTTTNGYTNGVYNATTPITSSVSGGSITVNYQASNSTGTLLKINSTSTYDGDTVVAHNLASVTLGSAGSLTQSNVKVNAGRLTGTGTIAKAVTIGDGVNSGSNGLGILSPGGSYDGAGNITQGIGTLSVGSLSLGPDGKYDIQINRTSLLSDSVSVTGNIVIDSAALLAITDLGTTNHLASSTKFTILQSAGAITGTFSGLGQGASLIVSGNTFYIDYETNKVQLWTVPVPEPTTLAGMMMGLGLLAVRRRASHA